MRGRPGREPAFARHYRSGGGQLPTTWRRAGQLLDLVNLGGLLSRAASPQARRALIARIERTLAERGRLAG